MEKSYEKILSSEEKENQIKNELRKIENQLIYFTTLGVTPLKDAEKIDSTMALIQKEVETLEFPDLLKNPFGTSDMYYNIEDLANAISNITIPFCKKHRIPTPASGDIEFIDPNPEDLASITPEASKEALRILGDCCEINSLISLRSGKIKSYHNLHLESVIYTLMAANHLHGIDFSISDATFARCLHNMYLESLILEKAIEFGNETILDNRRINSISYSSGLIIGSMHESDPQIVEKRMKKYERNPNDTIEKVTEDLGVNFEDTPKVAKKVLHRLFPGSTSGNYNRVIH